MSIAPTAHRVETHAPALDVRVVSVTELCMSDLVFDTEGMTHSLTSVELGMNSTVWIQRVDLAYVEHLAGTILVARATPERSRRLALAGRGI